MTLLEVSKEGVFSGCYVCVVLFLVKYGRVILEKTWLYLPKVRYLHRHRYCYPAQFLYILSKHARIRQ